MQIPDEGDRFLDYESLAMLGDGAGAEFLDLRPAPTELQIVTANRPKVDTVAAINSFLYQTDFEEHHSKLQVVHDVIGVVRRISHGDDESYHGKLLKERKRGGQLESARYGTAHIMGEKAVVYAMNWDFFAGSLGEVAGEKFVRATKIARMQHLPFVALYASGGARQQENTLALVQMQRIANAIGRYREDSNRPYLGLLVGQVWGGISASAVPLADLIVALAGTDYGFSGPRVIEIFQKSAVPPNAQSAEAAALDRNVDVIVRDSSELVDFVGKSLWLTRCKHDKLTAESRPAPKINHEVGNSRPITFGPNGFAAALSQNQEVTNTIHMTRRTPRPNAKDPLMERLEAVLSDAGRVDAEYIMQNVFDEYVPYYNVRYAGDIKKYPAIIASVCSIGSQSFMVIGDQPSYINRDPLARKLSANPKPEDFEYQTRMIKSARRLGLPLIFLTDTLGAEPTLVSERRGQSRAIAETLLEGAGYTQPVITLILGALGSGGGLATGPFKDGVLMLEDSLAFVSEPQSKASILYNTTSPTPEQVSLTLNTNKSTADDHHGLKLSDMIVAIGDSPQQTVANIREAVLDSFLQIQDLSARQRRRRIADRVGSRGFSRG
jgi:acetyl-CoA carboxylase beta subunit/acetyl-CoA carboxylase alpha subunit